jgi:type II secretory pathway pseudopilin PulG
MSHFIFQSRQTWLAVLGLLIVVAAASAQNATAEQTQKRFATAEEAVQGVIKAAKTNNQAELLAIFGADAEDLFSSGDKVADKRSRQVILVALKERWKLASQGPNQNPDHRQRRVALSHPASEGQRRMEIRYCGRERGNPVPADWPQ